MRLTFFLSFLFYCLPALGSHQKPLIIMYDTHLQLPNITKYTQWLRRLGYTYVTLGGNNLR